MKRYSVNFYFTSSAEFTVEAESPEKALEKANEKVTEMTKANNNNQIMHNLWTDDSSTCVEEL